MAIKFVRVGERIFISDKESHEVLLHNTGRSEAEITEMRYRDPAKLDAGFIQYFCDGEPFGIGRSATMELPVTRFSEIARNITNEILKRKGVNKI